MQKLEAALLSLVFAAAASGGAITITSYDLLDLPASGYGGWDNSYTGTITPLGVFNSYNLVNETGGSGTLNDGLTVTPETASVFFDDTTPMSPEIVLHLSGTFTLASITLFEDTGNSNAIPGALTGVTVQIGSSTAAITGSSTGSHSKDLQLNIAASSLSSAAGDTVTLSNFQGSWFNDFDLNEIELSGGPSESSSISSVPEPSSLALLSVGVSIVAMLFRTEKARRIMRTMHTCGAHRVQV